MKVCCSSAVPVGQNVSQGTHCTGRNCLFNDKALRITDRKGVY